MPILSSLRASRPTLSFEFFPPKNELGSEELLETVNELGKLDPAFVSVTYGAGGMKIIEETVKWCTRSRKIN